MTTVIRNVRCTTRGCNGRALPDTGGICRSCLATGARTLADDLPKALLWLDLNRLEHLTPQPGWERNGACHKTGNTAAFYPEPTDDATKKKAKARCARLGIAGTTHKQYCERGLTEEQADRLALRAGYHPAEVWREWLAIEQQPCGTRP